MIYLVTYKTGAQQPFEFDSDTARKLAKAMAAQIEGALWTDDSAIVVREIAGFAPKLDDDPVLDRQPQKGKGS